MEHHQWSAAVWIDARLRYGENYRRTVTRNEFNVCRSGAGFGIDSGHGEPIVDDHDCNRNNNHEFALHGTVQLPVSRDSNFGAGNVVIAGDFTSNGSGTISNGALDSNHTRGFSPRQRSLARTASAVMAEAR